MLKDELKTLYKKTEEEKFKPIKEEIIQYCRDEANQKNRNWITHDKKYLPYKRMIEEYFESEGLKVICYGYVANQFYLEISGWE